MATSFHKDCVPWSRVVCGPCLQLQMSNLVSSSALRLEQVNLLWVFPTGSLNFTRGGDAINSLFHCLTSPILLLSGWNFLSTSLSQLHLLLSLGLTQASLHTPSRQLQAAMAAVLPVFQYLQSSSEHRWFITFIQSLVAKQRILPSLRYPCSIRKLQDEPSLSCLWVWENWKCSPGNCNHEYLSPG